MSNIKKNKSKIYVIIMILIIVSAITLSAVSVLNWKPFDNQSGKIYIPDEKTNIDNDGKTTSTNKRINFLVLGVDESETLTDVIMVVSVNTSDDSVQILQIPRDSYVSETIGTGKINGMYNLGDKELQPVQRLIKTIDEQFKLKIDYYGIFTLDAFRDAVDAMGGIPINMPQKLVYDPSKIIPAGEQVLDGEKAEWLVRHRSSYWEGDIGRIKMQRIFLAAVVERAKSLGILKLSTKVIPKIYDDISSNLAIKDVISFADDFISIKMDDISVYMVPGEGMTYEGQSVWAIHGEQTAQMLNDYFREDGQEVSLDDLDIIDLGYTGDWYENTDDNFEDLIEGVKPGQKNEETSETETDGTFETKTQD